MGSKNTLGMEVKKTKENEGKKGNQRRKNWSEWAKKWANSIYKLIDFRGIW